MRESQRLYLLKVPSIEILNSRPVKTKRGSEFARAAAGSYREKLMQAGISLRSEIYIVMVLALALFVGFLLSKLGALIGVFATVACAQYFGVWYLEERALKRRYAVLPQLSGFIDGISSALNTGFNIDTAVIQASEGVPLGLLKEEIDRVAAAIKKGMTLEEAFESLKHRIVGKEVVSIAIAISMFHTMGGRVLEPFRRLAQKIRDQQMVIEKANRDLVQIKLAFQIIFGLSWIAPALMLVTDPSYLNSAFSDPLGLLLLQIAAIIQISSLLVFKRISSFRF